MNERIRKLLEQAEKHVYEMWVNEGTPLYPESHDLFIQQKDKIFAELIIQECAALDFRVRVRLSSDHDYEVSNTIKQHFGVE